MYTVKQISDLAGVSVRTLHYYDEIGLLKPSKVGANGYRYYDDHALFRLQQILFYREVGLELDEIKRILDSPNFDLVEALRAHRNSLQDRIERMQALVNTVDSTIDYLRGDAQMSKKALFGGFSKEKQAYYERVARLQYGPELVNESVHRWNSYSEEKQEAVKEEGGQIYVALADALRAGTSPSDSNVQELVQRWHEHIRYFYEPTLEILRGLGQHYKDHPEFAAFFQRIHANLPEYLCEAITIYVDELETREIESLLAEDQESAQKR